jgi:hypothetical protein
MKARKTKERDSGCRVKHGLSVARYKNNGAGRLRKDRSNLLRVHSTYTNTPSDCKVTNQVNGAVEIQRWILEEVL